jgi:hypothetical protein
LKTLYREYGGADQREQQVYENFLFKDVSLGEQWITHLRERFAGFDNFLGTVDALVIGADYHNVPKIASELSKIVDDNKVNIKDLEMELEILGNMDGRVRSFVDKLLNTVNDIMGDNAGIDALNTLASRPVIEEYGMTAVEEEEKFRDNFYNTNTGLYGLYKMEKGCNDKFDRPSEHLVNKWNECALETKEILKFTEENSISYIHTKLIGGALYERAMAVWAATAYKYLLPDISDLERLAQLVGTNPNMSPPGKLDAYKRANRLAKVYIGELVPGVQFLCQKLEFLILRIFEIAWISLSKKPDYALVISALGPGFKEVVASSLATAVRSSARLAYNRAFFDLDNEAFKLFPYQGNSPAASGLSFAFKNRKDAIEKIQQEYKTTVAKAFMTECEKVVKKDLDPSMSESLNDGFLFGINLLAEVGAINPLVFVGLHVVKAALRQIQKAWDRRSQSKSGGGGNEENLDLKALGLATSLYLHFLPRFISTVDGRMRADIWSSLNNTPKNHETIETVVVSELVRSKTDTANKHKSKIGVLGAQNKDINAQRKDMDRFRSKFASFMHDGG